MGSEVAIVDYDCMSCLGTDFRTTWERLVRNESGIRVIDRFDPSQQEFTDMAVLKFGGQIPVSYAELAGSDRNYKKWSEPSYHGVKTVCHRLLRKLDFDISRHDPQRIGMLGGTARTTQITQDEMSRAKRPDVRYIPLQCHNMPLAAAAQDFGIQGPSFTIGGACASSGHALYVAQQFIKSRILDCCLVAGFEFPIVPPSVGGFGWLGASYKADRPDDRAFADPTRACRPFSVDRRGLVPAEGIGVMLLSRADYAQKMGWPIKGLLRGGYCNSDSYHVTNILSSNVARCIQEALKDAGCGLDEVGCLNAHATSTPMGDAAELTAMFSLFGDRLRRVPLVANKSQLGHTLGAASILSVMAAVEGMNEAVVLPTLNYIPDPALPAAFIPTSALEHRCGLTLVNSFGFGGTNCSLVVGRA